MKKLVSIAVLLLLSAMAMRAQEVRYEVADSVVYRQAAQIDSTLYGRNVLSLLPSRSKGDNADVHVYQSQAIVDALGKQIASNPTRTVSGYRVRIFFDNSQTSRKESEAILSRFATKYPGIAAYRSYQSPYFKVTVGDFRTKSEAMELLERIKGEFPAAFVLKENINYPVVDKEHAYVTDTVKVNRKALR